jgi:hypothetical protein
LWSELNLHSHTAQSSIPYAALQFARGHGLHDH